MKIEAEALLQRLVDESDILRVISEIDQAVDEKDWPRVRKHFEDTVTLDLPTLGGFAKTMSADEFVRAVASSNFAEKKTYHGRLNAVIDIEGDSAESRCHMYGWNFLSEMSPPFWEMWGQFFYKLRRTGGGWKVHFLRQTKFHERGNPAVGTALPKSTA